ncbi:hypothetical protein GCM10007320_43570 [Pseudorhodoferax aquiterrae]|uniref:Uncharacterized protein n=1 Tax=Pseudorhodoferax aquiterrae TaxID=747304 RepID=A0ABQ3G7Z6_9BURK|nr:hypothetical protein [Pseudorhodoferax aquiterrae]GHC92970.1 hypothetical protein GCM10007320_43570 [Pseudorhodoferax aquiterrae]
MHPYKRATRNIKCHPFRRDTAVLADLILSLESHRLFSLQRLFDLNGRSFRLAVALMGEWKRRGKYAKKAKLLDLSVQLREVLAERRPSGEGASTDEAPARQKVVKAPTGEPDRLGPER